METMNYNRDNKKNSKAGILGFVLFTCIGAFASFYMIANEPEPIVLGQDMYLPTTSTDVNEVDIYTEEEVDKISYEVKNDPSKTTSGKFKSNITVPEISIDGEKLEDINFEILEKFFVPKNKQVIEDIKGYTIKYGNIFENDEVVDEVLVSYFKAPKSYTTEDMCEINSHGGNVIVKRILELCLKNGAEIAEPGEFTKRAFLNGRIDLLQAESVIDVIHAKSEKEAKTGIKQLEGFLSREIAEIKQEIMDVMVNIEVTIDYPEYDVDDVTNKQVYDMLDSVEKKLERLEKSFDNGKLIKEGIKTAIIGRPNAGKSSLLNAILKEDRAIVTEFEGTTRDTIEEFISVKGIPLKIIDTAGIRETDDVVEQIGVKKAKEIAEKSDVIIGIFDISRKINSEDSKILEIIKDKNGLILLNKIDLVENVDIKQFENFELPIIKISTKTGAGLEELYKVLENMYKINEISTDGELVVTNNRHKFLIKQAKLNLEKCRETILAGMPVDIISTYLKQILEELGKITGETVTDDVIKEIFSKFCLGK